MGELTGYGCGACGHATQLRLDASVAKFPMPGVHAVMTVPVLGCLAEHNVVLNPSVMLFCINNLQCIWCQVVLGLGLMQCDICARVFCN